MTLRVIIWTGPSESVNFVLQSPRGQLVRDNIQALFGLLLLGSAVARIFWEVGRSAPVRAADVRNLTRRLSRMVYLLLFLAVGSAQLIDSNSSGDLQVMLVYGLITLIAIRVLAIGIWRNLDRSRKLGRLLRLRHGD
jgi:cytochrome b561